MNSLRLSVPNALLFLLDPETSESPQIDGLSLYWKTPSCLAVASQIDWDGDTLVTIGTAAEVQGEGAPLFDGVLQTPSRHLALELVPRREVFRMAVRDEVTPVRIWTNRELCPDEVTIAVG